MGRRRRERDLHLAFDQLDGRQQEAGERAAGGPAGDERLQGKLAVRPARRKRGFDQVLRDPVAEEETAGFDGGAQERRADAPVETAHSFLTQGLSEAVQRPCVPEWLPIRLRLQSDFDGVEGVFDDFTGDAGDLEVGTG